MKYTTKILNSGHKVTSQEHAPIPDDITGIKQAALEGIKAEASSRIEQFGWLVERAKERAILGGRDTMTDTEHKRILQFRENVRIASNQAETDLNALATIEEVKAFTW